MNSRYQPEYDKSGFEAKKNGPGFRRLDANGYLPSSHTAQRQDTREHAAATPYSRAVPIERRGAVSRPKARRPWATVGYWTVPALWVLPRMLPYMHASRPPASERTPCGSHLLEMWAGWCRRRWSERVSALHKRSQTSGASALCRPNTRSSAFGTRASVPPSTKGSAGHTRPFKCCEVPPRVKRQPLAALRQHRPVGYVRYPTVPLRSPYISLQQSGVSTY
jgi:hypothetical protein